MQSISPIHLEDHWFIFRNDRLLCVKSAGKFILPSDFFYQEIKKSLLRHHYLGLFNRVNCYCAEIGEDGILPKEIECISVRAAFEVIGMEWYQPLVKAYSIITWDKNTQFCSRCGEKTVLCEFT